MKDSLQLHYRKWLTRPSNF